MGSCGKLFLISVAFLYSIELSSQSSLLRSVNRIRRQAPMSLPPPYYYDENNNIRALGHSTAVPIIQRGVFLGMTDGVHFFPIVYDGRMFVINFNTRRYVEVKANERRAFLRNAEANMNTIRESRRRNNNL